MITPTLSQHPSTFITREISFHTYKSKFEKVLLETYGGRTLSTDPSSLPSILEISSEPSVPVFSVPAFDAAFLTAREVTSCHPSSLSAPSERCPSVVKFSSLKSRIV